MLEPEVETRPWVEQLALDDASYRTQLAYLLERSPFYREKLAGFDARTVKAIPILARTASLLAHLAEERDEPIGFAMAAAAEHAVTYER